MKKSLAAGVFADTAAAARARAELVAAGVAAERIHMSADLALDDIAAEAPGQSYELQNPSDSSAAAKSDARANALMRTGSCVLTVQAASDAEGEELRALMQRAGAHATTQAPQ